MLVVRRIKIGEINVFWHFQCGGQGVFPVNLTIAFKTREYGQHQFYVTTNPRQGVLRMTAKLAHAVSIFIKSFEHARCVRMDACTVNQRCQKEPPNIFRQKCDFLTRRINEISVAPRIEHAFASLNVIVILRRIQLRNQAAVKVRFDFSLLIRERPL